MSAGSGLMPLSSGKKRKIAEEDGPILEVVGTSSHHKVSFIAKIKGFSKLPCNVGSHVRTSVYEINGRLWGLKIFPGGSTTAFANMVSAFVFCLTELDTKAAPCITVLRPNGTESSFRHIQPQSKEFGSGNKGFEYKDWGTSTLCSRADMLSCCSPDDTVAIKVALNVVGPPAVYSSSTHRSPKKSKSKTNARILAPHLFLSPTFSDLTFQVAEAPVGPEEHTDSASYAALPAHKNIVCAASEVFARMLTVDMQEAQRNSVVIADYPWHLVKEMLRFIYKGYCRGSVLQTDAEGLLSLGKKYDIVGLVRYVEIFLAKQLNIHRLAHTWQISQMYECPALEMFILRFVSSNKELVGAQADFVEALGVSGGAARVFRMLCGLAIDLKIEDDSFAGVGYRKQGAGKREDGYRSSETEDDGDSDSDSDDNLLNEPQQQQHATAPEAETQAASESDEEIDDGDEESDDSGEDTVNSDEESDDTDD